MTPQADGERYGPANRVERWIATCLEEMYAGKKMKLSEVLGIESAELRQAAIEIQKGSSLQRLAGLGADVMGEAEWMPVMTRILGDRGEEAHKGSRTAQIWGWTALHMAATLESGEQTAAVELLESASQKWRAAKRGHRLEATPLGLILALQSMQQGEEGEAEQELREQILLKMVKLSASEQCRQLPDRRSIDAKNGSMIPPLELMSWEQRTKALLQEPEIGTKQHGLTEIAHRRPKQRRSSGELWWLRLPEGMHEWLRNSRSDIASDKDEALPWRRMPLIQHLMMNKELKMQGRCSARELLPRNEIDFRELAAICVFQGDVEQAAMLGGWSLDPDMGAVRRLRQKGFPQQEELLHQGEILPPPKVNSNLQGISEHMQVNIRQALQAEIMMLDGLPGWFRPKLADQVSWIIADCVSGRSGPLPSRVGGIRIADLLRNSLTAEEAQIVRRGDEAMLPMLRLELEAFKAMKPFQHPRIQHLARLIPAASSESLSIRLSLGLASNQIHGEAGGSASEAWGVISPMTPELPELIRKGRGNDIDHQLIRGGWWEGAEQHAQKLPIEGRQEFGRMLLQASEQALSSWRESWELDLHTSKSRDRRNQRDRAIQLALLGGAAAGLSDGEMLELARRLRKAYRLSGGINMQRRS